MAEDLFLFSICYLRLTAGLRLQVSKASSSSLFPQKHQELCSRRSSCESWLFPSLHGGFICFWLLRGVRSCVHRKVSPNGCWRDPRSSIDQVLGVPLWCLRRWRRRVKLTLSQVKYPGSVNYLHSTYTWKLFCTARRIVLLVFLRGKADWNVQVLLCELDFCIASP